MVERDTEAEEFVAAAAALMGVALSEAYRPGVVRNFQNFLALHRAVEGFEEPGTHDPAGLFRP